MLAKRERHSPDDPVAAPTRRFDVRRAVRVALSLAAVFAVVYLVAANVLLRSRLLRDLVSEGPGVELEYASAYSVWPGLVHVRGLELAVEDYATQLSVGADSAVVAIRLHDLLFRRFHVSDAALRGLVFRLRTKVEPGEAERPHVAAFPPIAGFADPPVRVGEKPPPIPDAEYDLWQIAIDEVDAELRELWLLEYRYFGQGKVRGGFVLQPARHFAVYPATVELKHGALSVGDRLAAGELELRLEGYVDATDVRQVEGAALAQQLSARVELSSERVDLAALDARASARRKWRVDGRGRLDVSASATRGRLDEGSRAELEIPALVVRGPFGKLSGAVSSRLSAGPEGQLDWVTTSPRLRVANASPYDGPVVATPRLQLALRSEVLGEPPSLRGVELDVPELVVPSLRWAERWIERSGAPFRVGGRMEGSARFSSAPGRGPSLRTSLRLADAELSTERVRASLRGRVDMALEPAKGSRSTSAGRLDVELEGVEVERTRERTQPFRAAVRLPDLKLALEPEPALSSAIEAFATPADSLLSVALGSPMLEDLAADLFSLKQLEAQARVKLSPASMKVELTRAESGALTGRGFWQRPRVGGARGAFLISSKVANVGISLVGSDTETAWFVADDWLAQSRTGPSASPARQRPAPARRPSASRGR